MKLLKRNEKLLICISTVFALSNVLSSIFLNVYLFTYTQSMVSMAIFTSIRLGLFPISELLAAKLARKRGYTLPIMIGLMMIMASLVFTLWVKDGFATKPLLIYVVAALTGIGEGFYYLCINTLYQKCTTADSRANFVTVNGVLGNIGTMIGPFISTFILSNSVTDLAGYTTIFQLILVFYMGIFIICGFLHVERETTQLQLRQAMHLKKDKHWTYCCLCSFINGVRDVFPLALSGLMVYEAAGGDGTTYSKLLSVFSIITIACCIGVKPWLIGKKWLKVYRTGAVISSISMLAMLVFNNLFGAILYGVCNALAAATLSNPWTIDIMNVMSRYQDSIMARMIAKEIALTIGRVGSMLVIVLLSFLLPSHYLKIGVLLAAASPIFLIIVVNRYHESSHEHSIESRGN